MMRTYLPLGSAGDAKALRYHHSLLLVRLSSLLSWKSSEPLSPSCGCTSPGTVTLRASGPLKDSAKALFFSPSPGAKEVRVQSEPSSEISDETTATAGARL